VLRILTDAMASIWSGYLTFGLISMPVRLWSGARGERVSFHMLHRDDNTRIKQQLWCPTDERVVERSEIVKGYEYAKGEYVVVEPEELKKIEPKTAKAMEILEFVPEAEVDPVYLESSYYLVPEEAGQRPYLLLQRALRETRHYAIAKLAMHNREYTVVIRPYRKGMMLHTMYYKDEIREVEQFEGLPKVDLKEAEVKVAHQLVEALATDFKPEKFHDTYDDNVKELIKAKLEGRDIPEVEKPRRTAPPVDLMAALKESLAQIEKKPARRVEVAEAASAGAKKKRPKKAA
jgi:DNA end-binding protein Ku